MTSVKCKTCEKYQLVEHKSGISGYYVTHRCRKKWRDVDKNVIKNNKAPDWCPRLK